MTAAGPETTVTRQARETDVDQPDHIDGRTARRERNRDAVLDTVLELVNEDLVLPSVDTIAERSGLSLRSLYRYYKDQDALMHAAIERSNELAIPLFHIHEFGTGPLDVRIERLVKGRMQLYEAVAATYRATVHNAPLNPQIAEALDATRDALRDQTAQQFAPELESLRGAERRGITTSCDVLTQLDSIEHCRRQRGLTATETASAIRRGLNALLRS
jgi:AcrR family transcriptional regulator